MANTIQIKRGLQAAFDLGITLAIGELCVATDTGNVYIGTTAGIVHVNPDGGLEPSGITPGTYTKVTINEEGLATSGTTLTASDIPDLALAKITDAGSAAAADIGTAAGEIPVLGTDGKLPQSVVPAIAITDVYTVASEAEMLALEAEQGDVAIRTDVSQTFILAGDDPTVLADWKQLATPTDAVASVNGKTGVVVLDASDVGLDEVDNTADADKPVSDATQAALDLKADLASPALTGTPTAPTATAGDSSTTLATTAFVGTAIAGAVIDGGTF